MIYFITKKKKNHTNKHDNSVCVCVCVRACAQIIYKKIFQLLLTDLFADPIPETKHAE